jgi:hypothetical protein
MRMHKNSISRVNLMDILRRRRKTLAKFLEETGIITYELLKSRCASMGVNPPSNEQWFDVVGRGLPSISSPAEGLVVLEPIKAEVNAESQAVELEISSIQEPEAKKKKVKKTTDDSIA